MNTVEPGLWRGNCKSWKMRNTLCKIWNVARNSENVKNEKYTLWDRDYGEKTKQKKIRK